MFKAGKSYIRVLYTSDKEPSFIEKASGVLNDTKNSIKSAADKADKFTDSMRLSTSALSAIAQAKISSNPKVQLVYDMLRTTGAITFDPLELIGRFKERDGGKGAKAILDALNAAEKGNIHIVMFEGGEYRTADFRTYERYIQTHPEKIDSTLIDGLVDNYIKTKDKSSFTAQTWSNIASYMASIGGNLKTPINTQSTIFLKELYKIVNEKHTSELNKIIDPVIERLGKQSPVLKTLLEKNNLLGKDGLIDFNKMILDFKIKNLNDFERIFKERAAKLLTESKELISLGNQEMKNDGTGKIRLSQLGVTPSTIIVQGRLYDLDNKNIDTYALPEIDAVLPAISGKLEKLKRENSVENDKDKIGVHNTKIAVLQGVINALTKKKLGYEKGVQGAQLKYEEERVKKIKKDNPNITKEDFVTKANTEKAKLERVTIGEVAVNRIHLDSIGTISLKEAQRLYTELENKGSLTEAEEVRKREYYAIIEANKKVADSYRIASRSLGESEAQELFTQTNRFISDNPKETYNFESLEKIAILTDPESTAGERSLAKLGAGQSLPMSQALEGELQTSIVNAPELKDITISKNSDGTYDIPTFNATRITQKQVEEYKKNTSMYAELGLSQFIPHIPLISTELRAKGINTIMDGKTGTMEQQQVLKALYSQLFGKQIVSSSLGDVERAFSRALGNPTNMKNVMQHILKIHKLIPDNGQAVRKDILTAWIRNNNNDNIIPDPIHNLT